MTERPLTTILENIARDAVPPAELDLWPGISRKMTARARPSSGWVTPRRLRIAASAFLVLATLVGALLVVGPDRALAALSRLIGYIPGIGFVQDAQAFRAIPEPVQQEREGVTLVVEQAVADSERTIILYKVEGLSLTLANAQGEEAPAGSNPVLRLPDGTVLDIVSGEGRSWGSVHEERLVYPALPKEVEAATFEIPRLMDMPAGAAPENWQIPLRFLPAPKGVTVLPVLEQGTSVAPQAGPTTTGEPVQAPYGISLSVDKSVQLGGSFLVEGSLRWNDRFPAENGVGAGDMALTDAAGLNVPIEPARPDSTTTEPYRSSWAFKTNDVSLKGSLTVTMQTVGVRLSEPASFQLDPGATPQDGQTWSLDQEIQLLGLPVRIVSAQFVEQRGMQGFEVNFKPDSHLLSFDMGLSGAGVEMVGNGGAGGSHPDESGGVVSIALIQGKISGPVTFTIVDATLRGPWTATWNAPAGGAPAATSSPTPQVCVNEAGLAQAVDAQPTSLPAGLGGQIAGYGPVGGSNNYLVYTARLDGSDLHVLGEGTWPSVSPDGSKTAYSASDGLTLADNVSGTVSHLPGTVEGDYGPRWSPDGSRIAFVRVADLNLYVIDADGSDLRQVTHSLEYELLAGWSPDGTQLYYAAPSESGQRLKSLDLATGAIEDLFTVGPKDVPSLSPDGKQLAYADKVFGKANYGLYLRSIDGSEPRLLAFVDGKTIAGHLWSPSGGWIMTSIYNSDEMFPTPKPVLINVNTCQVIRLPWLVGYVQGWVP